MKRTVYRLGETCASCGIPLIRGAMLDDLFPSVWKQGFRRTLDFPYDWYVTDYGHSAAYKPVEPVTADNCDSAYLGDVLTPDLLCPRCGGNPRQAVEEEWAANCRNCRRSFAEVEDAHAYTSIWNKRLQQHEWQCYVCQKPMHKSKGSKS